ncbi:MAG: hypothetical protein LBN40_05135 [Oscillospiraceae bacterium]|jgi:hypothetical protein|nr:hypothetical protein [Oscillospiraceae bacterium]
MTKTSLSKTTITSIVLLPVLTIVRLIQLKFAVDFNTGFFKSDAGATKWAFYLVILIAAVLLAVALLADKKQAHSLWAIRPQQLSERSAIMVGGLFLTSATIIALFPLGISADSSIVSQTIGCLLLAVPSVFILSRGKFTYGFGLSMLLPSGYFAYAAFVMFLKHFIILKVSDYIVRMVIYVALAVFFVSYARIITERESAAVRFRTMLLGYGVSLVILSDCISKWLLLFFSGKAEADFLSGGEAVFLYPSGGITLVALLVVCMTHSLTRPPKAFAAVAKETAEAATERTPPVTDEVDDELDQ